MILFGLRGMCSLYEAPPQDLPVSVVIVLAVEIILFQLAWTHFVSLSLSLPFIGT